MDHPSALTPPREGDESVDKRDEEPNDNNNNNNNVTVPQSPDMINPGDPLSASWRKEPLTTDETTKVTQILHACNQNDKNKLIALAATRGGFIEDHIRRLAWPVLLGQDDQQGNKSTNWKSLPVHKDEDQIKLDVHRAFVYYPTGESQEQIEGRKEELSDLITEVVRQHPSLSYFQGYHDVAQVLLLVLGARDAAPLLARLSLLRIRDFMLPTIAATNTHLQLLPAILWAADPVLCRHLSGLQPFFALAATLTLYAHDIEEYGGIARLFDFLLAREAVISVYLYATIIMTRKDELFEIEADEPEMLYAILCKLPKPLDIEDLVSRTVSLFDNHPPECLPFGAWRHVSAYSVLKTTRDPAALAAQTLHDGELLLKKHSDQIERQEARKRFLLHTRVLAHRYRRPAGALTLAVFAGLLSVWLGSRNGSGVGGQAAMLQGIIAGARARVVGLLGYTLAFVQR